MSLRLISHSSFVLSLSKPFFEIPLYRYGCAGTCCREIVFEMNRRSSWLYRLRAHCTLSTCFLSFPYLPVDSFLLRPLFSSAPISRLSFIEPFCSRSYTSCSKYSPCVTSVICHLFLPLWRQAADSSSGAGLLMLFPSLRACTEGGTFIDNHMRWSKQGLLWGIDSGDHGHYSTSRVWCSRTQPDSSLSLVLGVLIFV